MTYRHTLYLNEGPVEEVTSLSIVHETERSPTRAEKWIDRLLFWRLLFPGMKPRRVNRADVQLWHSSDGCITKTGNFVAHTSPSRITAVSGDPCSTPRVRS